MVQEEVRRVVLDPGFPHQDKSVPLPVAVEIHRVAAAVVNRRAVVEVVVRESKEVKAAPMVGRIPVEWGAAKVATFRSSV